MGSSGIASYTKYLLSLQYCIASSTTRLAEKAAVSHHTTWPTIYLPLLHPQYYAYSIIVFPIIACLGSVVLENFLKPAETLKHASFVLAGLLKDLLL